MKTLSNQFATLAAVQQVNLCPNFDSQAFKVLSKGKKLHKFSSDQKAIEFIDNNGKPFVAKKENGKIFFAL
jgi:hypothetical protein